MDLRHMRHFVAVAEELHFGRAALRLNIAQPPLSQSIQRLELDLGVSLLNRSRRGVEMTDAGRAFLVEARRTLIQAELSRKVARRAAEHKDELRISFVGPALYRFLPQLLATCRETHRHVNTLLYEKSSPEQMPGMLAGEFDIGFVTAATDQIERCESLLVERSAFLAAVPGDSALARHASVSLATLAEQDFISAPRKLAPQGYDVLSMFKSAGVIPRVTQEATQTNTTLSLVSVGLGCGIVAGTAALRQTPNVTFLPITDMPAYMRWELVMVWRPDHLSATAAAFVEVAKSLIAAHPEWLDVAPPINLITAAEARQ
ncbi:LysR substrate-binding domain-containing protein [Sphingomonas psychrolutea]|uniref:Transcriptional regulator n=1 Tax=Sphingomonas psychrolutea TaxID=1259676 RepID=A0ABQ1G571_9SPHN|nr:LysR substrate-binding domain-containing protein [Sphingomonas psychrolutea]GGA36972.1 transcriptional regulator [Sphingomonas psychrolutea]